MSKEFITEITVTNLIEKLDKNKAIQFNETIGITYGCYIVKVLGKNYKLIFDRVGEQYYFSEEIAKELSKVIEKGLIQIYCRTNLGNETEYEIYKDRVYVYSSVRVLCPVKKITNDRVDEFNVSVEDWYKTSNGVNLDLLDIDDVIYLEEWLMLKDKIEKLNTTDKKEIIKLLKEIRKQHPELKPQGV